MHEIRGLINAGGNRDEDDESKGDQEHAVDRGDRGEAGNFLILQFRDERMEDVGERQGDQDGNENGPEPVREVEGRRKNDKKKYDLPRATAHGDPDFRGGEASIRNASSNRKTPRKSSLESCSVFPIRP